MREQLLGYLLNALEPDEKRELERRLSIDPDLRRDLELLRRSLEPLDGSTSAYDPPDGLAERTCDWISGLSDQLAPTTDADRAFPADGDRHADETLADAPLAAGDPLTGKSNPGKRRTPPLAPNSLIRARFAASPAADFVAPPTQRWGLADVAVTAGIVVTASLLFFPVLASMRYQTRVTACREKMHRVGTSLIDYSRLHGDVFPEVPQAGPLGHAGVYAPRLQLAHLLSEPSEIVCPGQSTTATIDHIPTIDELEHADSAVLDQLTSKMGGSYGYALGYVAPDGKYHYARNLNRAHFALLADAPQDHALGSLNHGCGGQNVFFEDGHATFLSCCKRRELGDDLFANHQGFVGAGIGEDDVVIGSSAAAPVFTPTKLER